MYRVKYSALALLAVLLGLASTAYAAQVDESAKTDPAEQATTTPTAEQATTTPTAEQATTTPTAEEATTTPTAEEAEAAQQRHEVAAAQVVVDDALNTFKNFQADTKQILFRNNVAKARGILIVPRLGKGGFLLAGSGGRGLMLARNEAGGGWSQPAFYTMGSASIGFQLGAQESEVILLVMTDEGLNSLLETKAQLGADVSVTAGSVGLGAQAATPDVLAFSRSQGIFGGISAEGTVIKPDQTRNSAYYGKLVTTEDILMRHKVINTYATDLVSYVTQGTVTE